MAIEAVRSEAVRSVFSDRFWLDYNVSVLDMNPAAAYIFTEPPYGGWRIGAETFTLVFKVANGIKPPGDWRAPRVSVYRTYYVPQAMASPRGSGLHYVNWADHKGGAFGVDNYQFNVMGLKPDTPYYVEIEANAATEAPRGWGEWYGHPLSVKSFVFRTARRDVTVEAKRLIVRLDGDPNESGEMFFEWRVFDGGTGQPFGVGRYPKKGYADLPDGRTIDDPFGSTPFVKQGASKSINMYIYGEEDDRSWLPFGGFPLHGDGPVEKSYSDGTELPYSWGAESGTDVAVYSERAWSFLSSVGVYEQPFVLFSGNFAISFTLEGKIRAEVVAFPQPPTLMMYYRPFVPIPQGGWAPEPIGRSANFKALQAAQRARDAELERGAHGAVASTTKPKSASAKKVLKPKRKTGNSPPKSKEHK